jgi:aconitate hydratase
MDSFATRSELKVGTGRVQIFSLRRLAAAGLGETSRLPYCLKVLLENLLRHEDRSLVRREDIAALAGWDPAAAAQPEIAFMPARVLLQDFTGVPAVVDLAAMRDAMARMGGDPSRINPLQPAELVIDHSVQVDRFGALDAFKANADLDYQRNRERYGFLRWGQHAFRNFRVVPPATGIVHQVNLEKLANVVIRDGSLAYPDTLVGTDSHTTMINGLGVLGWGVGGIEAEAAMLGQPITMLVPPVVGVRLQGRLREGATATDLVLTVTELLRKKNVVGKFVEFFGPGLESLPLADRATLANMAPEYGATCGIFPIDAETLHYLRLSGREAAQVELVEAYAKEQGFWAADCARAVYSERVELELSSVEPSLAGPRRPQDRVALGEVKAGFQKALAEFLAGKEAAKGPAKGPAKGAAPAARPTAEAPPAKNGLPQGAVVIAAITSCTNTSNPSVMIGAGLLAKKAVERGLTAKPWVKTSLAPGSKVVTGYLERAGLTPYLDRLGFQLVGYGCTTCIGNSGPLPDEVARSVKEGDLYVAAVLSGNRNFEGRINPLVRANYLASPPLVVAYALAGRMDIDLSTEPLGSDPSGRPVYLRDLWPSGLEVSRAIESSVGADLFRKEYAGVFEGDARWTALPVPSGDRYAWDASSTYIQEPPFFDGMALEPEPPEDIRAARVLAVLGDSITTDHISPAGSIPADSPAGKYLIEHGVAPRDFNSYGSRRGNHQVMIRGTFANIRLKNRLAPGTEGGWTAHLPDRTRMTIFDAAERYREGGVPLLVLAGKEYGSGSSRDWAAKGPRLLGVRAAIAESYERIHRSNLLFMGILPLEYRPGESAETLGLTGEEAFDIGGIRKGLAPRAELPVRAVAPGGRAVEFRVVARLDTPKELEYYRHGGILPYVLRQLLGSPAGGR